MYKQSMPPDWTFWASGGLIGLGALLLLLWAVFYDRSRGSPRCPRCWHNMTGVEGLRCPECGRTCRRGRQLRKTRRRWRWAVLAIVPGAGGGLLSLTPQIRDDGWPSIIPTVVLIQTQRFVLNEWPLEELDRRLDASGDPLSESQWRQLGNVSMAVLSGDHEDTVKRWACVIVARAIAMDLITPDDDVGKNLYALAKRGLFDGVMAAYYTHPSVFARLGEQRESVADAVNHVLETSTLPWQLRDLMPLIAQLPAEDQPLFLPGLAKLAERIDSPSPSYALLGLSTDVRQAQVGMINASYAVGAVSDEQLKEHIGEAWHSFNGLSMPVLTRLSRHADPNARLSAARHLAERWADRKDAVAALWRLLEDDDARVRLAAISGLVQFDKYAESFSEQLASTGENGPTDLQVEALAILQEIGPQAESAYPALLRILEREEDYPIWDHVIDAIESIKQGGSEYWLPDRSGTIPAERDG